MRTRNRVDRAVRVAFILTALSGCRDRMTVSEAALELTETPLVLHFPNPYDAEGPTRELCLTGASTRDARLIAPPSVKDLPTPVTAVLIRMSGERDTLGHNNAEPAPMTDPGGNTPSIAKRSDRTVCLWDHGLSNPKFVGPERRAPPLKATYTGVELRSAVPIRLNKVSLWTGQRRALL